MSRALRIEFPGAHYHVMSRGNARQRVFLDDADHHAYLDLLGETCMRFDWHCHAHCLMPNHVHLLIETRAPNLSRGMRHLNGVFTQRYNERHKRVGHLFQGRYKAPLVDRDEYFVGLVRYILLNPVRARLVSCTSDWRWSSYSWSIGHYSAPTWASPSPLWAMLGTNRASASSSLHALLAHDPLASEPDWESGTVIGSDAFKLGVASRLEPLRCEREHTAASRFADRPTLEHLFRGAARDERDAVIGRAVLQWGYPQVAIARFLGLSPTTISDAVRRNRDRILKT